MAAPLIGRTVRRHRIEQGITQQALAVRLGISASYLNLIEHEQRAVTASLLIKLAETLCFKERKKNEEVLYICDFIDSY